MPLNRTTARKSSLRNSAGSSSSATILMNVGTVSSHCCCCRQNGREPRSLMSYYQARLVCLVSSFTVRNQRSSEGDKRLGQSASIIDATVLTIVLTVRQIVSQLFGLLVVGRFVVRRRELGGGRGLCRRRLLGAICGRLLLRNGWLGWRRCGGHALSDRDRNAE